MFFDQLSYLPYLVANCQKSKFCLSKYIWEQFSYLRCVYRDYKSDKSKYFEVDFPDDFIDVLEFISNNKIAPKLNHDVVFSIKDKLLCLGLDPTSQINGKLENLLYNLAIEYSRSMQISDTIQKIWGNLDLCFGLYKINDLKTICMESLMSHQCDPIVDLRDVNVLIKIKSDDNLTSREQSIKSLIENMYKLSTSTIWSNTSISF